MSERQFRYVFVTNADDASLYHVVQPTLTQVSEELVDPQTLATTTNAVFNLAAGERVPEGRLPKVTITVDQRTGQVNALVSPLVDEYMPRTPALQRIQSAEQEPTQFQRPRLPSLAPPEKSRLIAPSPIGLAIRSPGGTTFLPAGSIKTPNGDIYTPKGISYSPNGTCYWPKGTQFDEQGYAVTPAGTTYTPSGTGFGISGHVYTPQGTVYSPSGLAYTGWRGTFNWREEEEAAPPRSPAAVTPRIMYSELNDPNAKSPATHTPHMKTPTSHTPSEAGRFEEEAARAHEEQRRRQQEIERRIERVREQHKQEIEAIKKRYETQADKVANSKERAVTQIRDGESRALEQSERRLRSQMDEYAQEAAEAAQEEERKLEERRRELQTQRERSEEERARQEEAYLAASRRYEEQELNLSKQQSLAEEAEYKATEESQRLEDARRAESAQKEAEQRAQRVLAERRQQQEEMMTRVQTLADDYDNYRVVERERDGYNPNVERVHLLRQASEGNDSVTRPVVPGESTVMYRVKDYHRDTPVAQYYAPDSKGLIDVQASQPLTHHHTHRATHRTTTTHRVPPRELREDDEFAWGSPQPLHRPAAP